MAERLARRRKLIENDSNYVDCSFILGSVAEVGRMWSVAGNAHSQNRTRETPQSFEALFILKYNSRF